MIPPFAKGDRIKVLDDNGRLGLIEYQGMVEAVTQQGAIVILDADPANRFRLNMTAGFTKPHKDLVVRRFFMFKDIEKLPRPQSPPSVSDC